MDVEVVQLFGEKCNRVSIINDPFSSIQNIDQINMHFYRRKALFSDKEVVSVIGDVHFVNGKTEGAQKFEANNLTELFEKIRDFCLSFKE